MKGWGAVLVLLTRAGREGPEREMQRDVKLRRYYTGFEDGCRGHKPKNSGPCDNRKRQMRGSS